MTTFEEWLLKAKDAADAVGKKTSELTETVKIKTKIAGVRRELNATFEGMGRLLYDGRQKGEDVTELLEAAMVRADELSAEIIALEDELCRTKKAVRCAACGEIVAEDATFCSQCGQPIVKE